MTNDELQCCIHLYLRRESIPAGAPERDDIDDELDTYWARADDAQRGLIARFLEQLHAILEPFSDKSKMSVHKAAVLYAVCLQARGRGESDDRVLKAQAKASAVLATHGISCPPPKPGQSFASVLDGLLEGESIE